MPSPEASRANGRKSRGPVTPQGKARSSKNALKHGLRSRSGLITATPESQTEATCQHGLRAKTRTLALEADQQVHDILAKVEAEYEPRSQREHVLVARLAAAITLQYRIWSLEKRLLDCEIARVRSANPNESAATLLALAFRSLADRSCALQILGRHESRCDRQFDSAVRQLQALKTRKNKKVDERTYEVIENMEQAFENRSHASLEKSHASLEQAHRIPRKAHCRLRRQHLFRPRFVRRHVDLNRRTASSLSRIRYTANGP